MARDASDLMRMVVELQGVGHGDAARLEHIAETIAHNRAVYNSDRQYVERKFAELGKGNTLMSTATDTSRRRTPDRAAYGIPHTAGHAVRPTELDPRSPRSTKIAMRETGAPGCPPTSPQQPHTVPPPVNEAPDHAPPESDAEAPAGRQPTDADRLHRTPVARGRGARFKVGVVLVIFGVLVLMFDALLMVLVLESEAILVSSSDVVLLVSTGGIGLILFFSGLILALTSRK